MITFPFIKSEVDEDNTNEDRYYTNSSAERQWNDVAVFKVSKSGGVIFEQDAWTREVNKVITKDKARQERAWLLMEHALSGTQSMSELLQEAYTIDGHQPSNWCGGCSRCRTKPQPHFLPEVPVTGVVRAKDQLGDLMAKRAGYQADQDGLYWLTYRTEQRDRDITALLKFFAKLWRKTGASSECWVHVFTHRDESQHFSTKTKTPRCLLNSINDPLDDLGIPALFHFKPQTQPGRIASWFAEYKTSTLAAGVVLCSEQQRHFSGRLVTHECSTVSIHQLVEANCD